jgi:microcystin-dependent protein
MQLLIDANAVAVKPAKTQTGITGYAQPGNVTTNSPASKLTYDCFNTILAELSNVVTNVAGGNTTLSTTNDGQVLTAIALMISNAVGAISLVPTATIFYRAQAAVPAGYLLCDGTAVSRTTYATLFAAIGITYGAGNGTTTFNLPDLRGVFPRGLDLSKGYDTGRAIGSYQADNFKAHLHAATSSSVVTDPGHIHTSYAAVLNANSDPNGGDPTGVGSSYFNTTSSITGITVATNTTTTNTGGTETVPKNVALYPIIKI